MSDTQGNTPDSTPNEGSNTGSNAESDASAQPVPTPEVAAPDVAPAAAQPAEHAQHTQAGAFPADGTPTDVIPPATSQATSQAASQAASQAETVPQHPVAPGASAPAAPPAQPTPPTPGAAAPHVYGSPAYPQPVAQGQPNQPGAPGASAAYGQPQYPAASYPTPHDNYAGGHPAAGQAYATAPGSSFGPAGQAGQAYATADPTATPTAPTTQKPAGKAGKVVGILVAAALVGGGAGFGGAALWGAVGGNGTTGPAAGPSTAIVNNPQTATLTTEIAAKVVPSVVTLDVSGKSQAGSGSGVILSSDGYLLTNTHVVTLDGAESNPTIRATTSDGRIFTAKIVGLDPLYDLAVLKLVDASGLTPIEFANSSKLNVGDTAIAVGAPLGLANTVTDGIVSALNRSIEIASSAVPESSATQQDAPKQPSPGESQGPGEGGSPWFFDIPGQNAPKSGADRISIAVIQTDAAINPGNSGGALVNGKGQLIGINVAIATASGTGGGQAGSIGVGFAIPSNVAERISSEIIESGAATHGLLGATVQSAASQADATVAGALIHELTPGGAAEKAGLQPGDVVTEFNGSPITSAVDLTAQVRAVAAGSTVELTYLRGTTSHTVDVTLGGL